MGQFIQDYLYYEIRTDWFSLVNFLLSLQLECNYGIGKEVNQNFYMVLDNFFDFK